MIYDLVALGDLPSVRVGKCPYIADLVAAFGEKDLPPGVYSVLVAHDAWCTLLKNRGPCNCNPDIEIKR